MAVKYIKKGITEADSSANQARATQIVEGILSDVQERRDVAVRELSARFDNWSPGSFRLSDEEIKDVIATVPEETIDDIKWAQAQVRRFP
ncbi:MAG TPA: histidinol dehydrogenase, partial [Chitinophagaceae bacterium]|nr:histidinol dehydrogenase [Chitinophagaceae bacterium]